VAKITHEEDCKQLPFEEIGRKGGFIFYKRILPSTKINQ
jgi:hypothetical protein